jgi:crossover junction endodeoxyribonuclease RusA
MIVSLPFPDKSLFPNAKNGRHWGGPHPAKVEARLFGWVAAKQAQLKHEAFKDDGGPIPVSIVFCQPDKRRRDLDNMLAAMKSALDGVAEALGVDDSRFRPILIDVGEVEKPGRVIVGVGVQIVTSGVI